LTKEQKAEKVDAEAERQRKIQRTADERFERLRANAEIRCGAGVERLADEATRKSSRRKCHPLTDKHKSEKTRIEAERRSVIKLTAEQKSEKAII